MLGAEQMVGDDEQYAVAMSLLANELGIPARVVMGFHPDEDAAKARSSPRPATTCTRGSRSRSRASAGCRSTRRRPRTRCRATRPPSPAPTRSRRCCSRRRPQQEPVDLPPTVPDEREDDDDENAGAGILGLVLAIAAGARCAAAARGAVRRDRRAEGLASSSAAPGRARAPTGSAAAGTRSSTTPRTTARRCARERPGSRTPRPSTAAFAQPQVVTLARRADAEVFGPAEPSDADVEEFWRQVDEIVDGMARSTSFWGRLRARLNLRSLLAGTRFALPMRSQAEKSEPTATTPRRAVRQAPMMPSRSRSSDELLAGLGSRSLPHRSGDASARTRSTSASPVAIPLMLVSMVFGAVAAFGAASGATATAALGARPAAAGSVMRGVGARLHRHAGRRRIDRSAPDRAAACGCRHRRPHRIRACAGAQRRLRASPPRSSSASSPRCSIAARGARAGTTSPRGPASSTSRDRSAGGGGPLPAAPAVAPAAPARVWCTCEHRGRR